MKIAIISVTTGGAELGQRICLALKDKAETLHGSAQIYVYEKEGRESEAFRLESVGSQQQTVDGGPQWVDFKYGGDSLQQVVGVKTYSKVFQSLKDLIPELMAEYEVLLFIMATGIVVRMIAPYIKHKSVDPAVVSMDEQGQFAISLLSGHLGGANEWAHIFAHASGATPVITTATDVKGLSAPDVLARKLNFEVDNFTILKHINAAIVANEPVSYYLDDTLYFAPYYKSVAQHMGISVQTFNPYTVAGQSLCQAGNEAQKRVIITDLNLPIDETTLYLRPKTITLGIGCRRGTSRNAIKAAIEEALALVGRSAKSVMSVGSVTVKADEVGLLEAVKDCNWSIHFHTPAAIEEVVQAQGLEESKFVKETIGVGNVCETTALLEAKSQTLLLKKTKYQGITIAIAQVQSRSLA